MASNVRIEPITSPTSLPAAFYCIAACFGHQINDALWTSMNPGWDTPAGAAAGTSRMVSQFRSVTTNSAGDPNTVYLAATIPYDASDSTGSVDGLDTSGLNTENGEKVIGVSVWVQHSDVPGHGDPLSTDITQTVDLTKLYPGNESQQRFCKQAIACLLKNRVDAIAAKKDADPPALLAMDLCVVHPAFQRRGVAEKMVRWGLEEARRRGRLEVTTEGSVMGRGLYRKLGFRGVREVEYVLDEEFRERKMPPNLFLRTGGED